MLNLPSQVVMQSVAALRPYSGNARQHSKKQVRQIADSIKRFGFTNPVLVSDEGEIIAGHGRVMAAKELGLGAVPTLKLSHLTAAERSEVTELQTKLNVAKAELATQISIYELCADVTGQKKLPAQVLIRNALNEVTNERSNASLTSVVDGAINEAREIQKATQAKDSSYGVVGNPDLRLLEIINDAALLYPPGRALLSGASWVFREGVAYLTGRSGQLLARVEGTVTEATLREATIASLSRGGAVYTIETEASVLRTFGGTTTRVNASAVTAEIETAAATKGALQPGATTAYVARNESGEVIYVGITDNFVVRATTHTRERGLSIQAIDGLTGIARTEARAIEQALIERFGLGSQGGTLLNKINSIATSNSKYVDAIARGRELLQNIRTP